MYTILSALCLLRGGYIFCRPQQKGSPSARSSAVNPEGSTHAPVVDDVTEPKAQKSSAEIIEELRDKLKVQKQELQEKDKLISELQDGKIERFGVERFGTDDALINFYTGFSSFKAYSAFFKFVQPTASCMTSMYYASSETASLAGRPRCMQLIDELFMFLCRVRVNLLELDISVRFNCSVSTISRKLITWANYLYFVLGSIPIWLSRSEVDQLMPDVFKTKYPHTRVIIDLY